MPDANRRPGEHLSYLQRAAGETAEGRSATLVLLHGFGKYQGHLYDLATEIDARFAIFALQAPFRIGPGAYRWFNYERAKNGVIVIDEREEQHSLDALLSFLKQHRSSEPDRELYLFGHSQGAMMSLSAALIRSELVDGCAVLNGRILPQTFSRLTNDRAVCGMPFFVGHGLHDATVTIENGRATRDRLSSMGAALEYHEYASGHDVTEQMISEVAGWLARTREARTATLRNREPLDRQVAAFVSREKG